MRFILTERLIQFAYILVASSGLALGFIGYMIQNGWNISSVPGVTLYALHLFIPRPSIVLDGCSHILIRTGAFLCGISGFIAAGLLWIAAANRNLSGIWTQYFRRGHVLIVGSSDFTMRFAASLRDAKKNVVHAIKHSPTTEEIVYSTQRPVFVQNIDELEAKAGLLRAKQVVVDIGSDTDNLAAATRILSRLNSEGAANIDDLAVRVGDPVLSDQFFESIEQTLSKKRLAPTIFDENLILARYTLARDPLFLRASARKQQRVHVLIVGFGDLGEKLLDQVMLTSAARELGTPRVSIIDQDAVILRQKFEARRPQVLSQLPIYFYQFNIGQDDFGDKSVPSEIEPLFAAEADDALTMIYLALPSQGDVTKAALLLDRAKQRTGFFKAPIAYRCRLAAEGEDFLVQSPPSLSSSHGFLRICVPTQAVAQAILGTAEADRMSIRIHDVYRQSGQSSSDADQPWSQLKDTYKRSNRRTLDHLPAKLWTAGVRPDLENGLTEVDKQRLRHILAGPDDTPLMMQLSRLEHERWCIDRRLDGWTYGDVRDNLRRQHDRLISFAELLEIPGEVEKDIGHIRELFRIVLESQE